MINLTKLWINILPALHILTEKKPTSQRKGSNTLTSAITRFMSSLLTCTTEQLLHCCRWACSDPVPQILFDCPPLQTGLLFYPFTDSATRPPRPSGWILAGPGLSHVFFMFSDGFAVCKPFSYHRPRELRKHTEHMVKAQEKYTS